jgi:23S rRNA (uracil1939-C5)-methyltransferase
MVATAHDRSLPLFGLYARGGESDRHRVVDIPGCRVLSAAVGRVASKLRELLRAPPDETGACLVPESSGGLLSAFDLREVRDASDRVLVTIVLGGEARPTGSRAAGRRRPTELELERTAQAIAGLSLDVLGVAVNFREPGGVQVLGAATRSLVGEAVARDRLGPDAASPYRLATFGSFTQAHRGQAARIEAWIGDRVGRGASVLDVYGGSGALSMRLAERGARVTLVESFRPAADAAERAAREQGITRFQVRSGDAGVVLDELAREGARFDAILTNPPRRGMPPAVRGAIAALQPRLVAYVSCDPDSLCRDLDHFTRLGYRPEALWPVDMIPLTDQVETVTFLTAAEPPAPRFVHEEEGVVVIDRSAHDPPDWGFAGARVLTEDDPAASGLAVGCTSASMEHPLRGALADASAKRVFIALCRGITAREGRIARRCEWRRLARVAGHSLLRLEARDAGAISLEKLLSRAGHPVIGDARHGHPPTNRHFQEKYALDRPFLHAARVDFAHPRTRARISGESRLPGELTMVLGRLGLDALDVAKETMIG